MKSVVTAATLARAAQPTGRGRPSGEVRIIGGQWRRSKLPVLNLAGLRPTPDRVRETLFNWLGQDLTGWRCWDAFAGSGALAFEAASRGAVQVVACDTDAALVRQLQANAHKLKATTLTIQRTDGLSALAAQAPLSFDLVLLDPPFEAPLHERSLQVAAKAIKADGFVYLETPEAWTEERLQPLGFHLHKYMRAGAVHAQLLRPCVAASAPQA